MPTTQDIIIGQHLLAIKNPFERLHNFFSPLFFFFALFKEKEIWYLVMTFFRLHFLPEYILSMVPPKNRSKKKDWLCGMCVAKSETMPPKWVSNRILILYISVSRHPFDSFIYANRSLVLWRFSSIFFFTPFLNWKLKLFVPLK